ncbi:hypothetical protein O9G_005819 [Rozella allomycis CSF55]|uniref:Uncharacterized protein n=1 Tax=Rozella allomycis (strain CSF55) TaxID=988480 RepID=A0A075B3D9_ROZAC|nr:hypothetical protein O9G_005819 [Rozella allomycis CSF55]|eukprot:EPZ36874.1 hypothetical protein O9G_005819 [Rozella allomycis CSF55]
MKIRNTLNAKGYKNKKLDWERDERKRMQKLANAKITPGVTHPGPDGEKMIKCEKKTMESRNIFDKRTPNTRKSKLN